MTLSYLKRVEAGARLLDAAYPYWANVIDLDTLEVEDSYHCILAQLYGSYHLGEQKLLEPHGVEGCDFGFDIELGEDGDKAYYWLQKRWVQQVKARRAA